MLIDVHTEVVTKSYLKRLLAMQGVPRMEKRAGNYALFYSEGQSYPVDKRMYDMPTRLEEMKKCGMDIQVLGLVMPGVDMFGRDLALEMAKEVNDEISEIIRENKSFLGLATIPMAHPDLAVEELERAIKTLGLSGIKITSNINGTPLDSAKFFPIYELAEKMNIPILIHPTRPLMVEAMKDYGLTTVVGFLYDTTLAMLRLIFGGVLEKYKNLKFILPHAGSTIPYLITRIDHQYKINPDCRKNITKMPSEYFKNNVYIDTAQSFYNPAIMCAYSLLGADKMVLGSDYPFVSLDQAVNSIKGLPISEEEKEKILFKNAKRLLKLN